jgi:hypothetical protein
VDHCISFLFLFLLCLLFLDLRLLIAHLVSLNLSFSKQANYVRPYLTHHTFHMVVKSHWSGWLTSPLHVCKMSWFNLDHYISRLSTIKYLLIYTYIDFDNIQNGLSSLHVQHWWNIYSTKSIRYKRFMQSRLYTSMTVCVRCGKGG